jgi:peroxiredoxin Q/BCP
VVPGGFTQGCTIECKSLAEHGSDIRKYDVTYFMASVDPIEGEKGNKAFAESQKADFPLLSDPTKKTAEAYGVLNAKVSPAAGRSTSTRQATSRTSTKR